MNQRPKTIICDIDGTLIVHDGGPRNQFTKDAIILNGVIDKFEEWDLKGYRIILLTGRKESMRKRTEEQLHSCGIFYDKLIMGVGGGQRVLINDLKPNPEDPNNPTAIAINVNRNEGISSIEL
jgi:FMN phosphatase YigB (HAD superfamily)